MTWLFHGATHYGFADWDIGISVLMGGLAYTLAPWSVRTLYATMRAPTPGWPWRVGLALGFAWFTVDGIYMAYHGAQGNDTYRAANAWASSLLFVLAGAVWAYRGSLAQLRDDVRSERRKR